MPSIFERYVFDKDLAGFKIVEMTVVFHQKQHTEKFKWVGVLRNHKVAELLAQEKTKKRWCQAERILVLTDGRCAFITGENFARVKILDDVVVLQGLRKKKLQEFSLRDQKLLGM